MDQSSESARQFLRHTLATVAYRGGKTLRGAPAHFDSFHIGDKTRTPAQILAHMGDLFDWALSIAKGQQTWHDSTPLSWNAEIERFFAAVKKFDDFLASGEHVHGSIEGIFKARLPTPSITSARSPCSAASRVPQSSAKTISGPKSPLAALARSNPLLVANSSKVTARLK